MKRKEFLCKSSMQILRNVKTENKGRSYTDASATTADAVSLGIIYSVLWMAFFVKNA